MSKFLTAVAATPSFISKVLAKLPAVLAEVVKLQNPVLDATIIADVLAVISPFGINVGSSGAVITNALVAVGVLATAIQKVIADLKTPTPAPAASRRRA